MEIGIIGAGPSGIFAALEARKNHDSVTIIDANAYPGRKLAATGAGRGNLTNIQVSPPAYLSLEQFSYSGIVKQYDYQFLNNYFQQLGIFTYHTEDGWVYPLSNSAKNVAELLNVRINQLGIHFRPLTKVIDISYESGKFIICLATGENVYFDKLVLACGGRAYPQLNASDDLLVCLQKMGHKILPVYPALSPIKTTKNFSNFLNGVRIDAECALWDGNKCLASNTGNIIFTEWGLNGPGIMNISHYVSQTNKSLDLFINFYNNHTSGFIDRLISSSGPPPLDLSIDLLTIFPQKIIEQLTHNAIHRKINFRSFSISDFQNISSILSIKENTKGTRGFDFCQLSTGGVSSSSINTNTLESLLFPGLFFAGEILDVIGPCGGYNLHWAFVSGIVAGKAI